MPDIFMKRVIFETFVDFVNFIKSDDRFHHHVKVHYNGIETCGDMEVTYGRNFNNEDLRKELRQKMSEIIRQM